MLSINGLSINMTSNAFPSRLGLHNYRYAKINKTKSPMGHNAHLTKVPYLSF